MTLPKGLRTNKSTNIMRTLSFYIGKYDSGFGQVLLVKGLGPPLTMMFSVAHIESSVHPFCGPTVLTWTPKVSELIACWHYLTFFFLLYHFQVIMTITPIVLTVYQIVLYYIILHYITLGVQLTT